MEVQEEIGEYIAHIRSKMSDLTRVPTTIFYFFIFFYSCLHLYGNLPYTRSVRKVSDLRLCLRARVLERPLRGMSVTSSP